MLPIGGVKEKVLAARRAGLKRVILPKGNQKDLRDLPEEVRKEMEFIFADRVGDVLADMLPGLVRRSRGRPEGCVIEVRQAIVRLPLTPATSRSILRDARDQACCAAISDVCVIGAMASLSDRWSSQNRRR